MVIRVRMRMPPLLRCTIYLVKGWSTILAISKKGWKLSLHLQRGRIRMQLQNQRTSGDGKEMGPKGQIHMYNEGSHAWFASQGGDTSRSYFQGQRPDSKHSLEKQSSSDSQSQPLNEAMDLGYEDKPSSQTIEDLEKKFLDDIKKLVHEQSDAEDEENARHIWK